jgi:hypothetical protein
MAKTTKTKKTKAKSVTTKSVKAASPKAKRTASTAKKSSKKASSKAAAQNETPRYLVLVFCGRNYQSLITTLATSDRKEAYSEATFLVNNSVSDKGDKVDVAVFNTAFPWDDKKGWKFF